MHKLVVPSLFFFIFCLCPLAYGAVPIVSGSNPPRFDRSRIPQKLKKDFDYFEAKCSPCHTLERIVVSFQTGMTSISGRPLDLDTIKSTLLEMMRKSTRHKAKGQEISKEEIKSILGLMKYFLDESVK